MNTEDHSMKCNNCGQLMDLRDLEQVFAHEYCIGVPIDHNKLNEIKYSSSLKIGDSVLSTKDNGDINLN